MLFLAWRTVSRAGLLSSVVKIILAMITLFLLTAAPVSANHGGWHQCQLPRSSAAMPCGSCSLSVTGAGAVSYGCELDCGGSVNNYPICQQNQGGYSVTRKWFQCRGTSGGYCGPDSSDFIGQGTWSGTLAQMLPQSNKSGTGSVANFDCGRIQVDVIMEGTGTSVAGGMRNTSKDCPGQTTNPTPTPTSSNIPECRPGEVNMSVSPSASRVGDTVTFRISGSQGSTWISDSFGGGVNCSGNLWGEKSCTATGNGDFTWTHIWKNCVGNFDNCGGVCEKKINYSVGSRETPTPTPSASATPTPTPIATTTPKTGAPLWAEALGWSGLGVVGLEMRKLAKKFWA